MPAGWGTDLRTPRGSVRPAIAADARSGFLFGHRSPRRASHTSYIDIPAPAGDVRHWHGRGMGRRGIADHGKSAREIARVLSGLLQEGYAVGYLAAALAYKFVFPHWGWRPLFWIGGLPAVLAIFVRLGGQGIRGVAEKQSRFLEESGPRTLRSLAGVSLHRGAHDDDEPLLARDAGPLSHVPSALPPPGACPSDRTSRRSPWSAQSSARSSSASCPTGSAGGGPLFWHLWERFWPSRCGHSGRLGCAGRRGVHFAIHGARGMGRDLPRTSANYRPIPFAARCRDSLISAETSWPAISCRWKC